MHPVVLLQSGDYWAVLNLRLNLTFGALLLYDNAISFDLEVARIWTLPWRLPRVLFLLNRWIVPIFLMFEWLMCVIPNMSEAVTIVSCTSYTYWQGIPTRLALLTAEALMVVRVSAIYGHNRAMMAFLCLLFLGETVVLTTMLTLGTMQTEAFPALTGCFIVPKDPNATLHVYASATWIAPVVFETIIMCLTLYRVVHDYSSHSFLLKKLARDSLIYFTLIFSLSVANVVLYMIPDETLPSGLLLGPTCGVTCLAVSRMMINMRKPLSSESIGTLSAFELAPMEQHMSTLDVK